MKKIKIKDKKLKKKTGFFHFKTKNACEINGKLECENKFIANLSDTNFLGLCLNNKVDWRVHIDHRMSKLSSAWCAIRTLQQSQDMLIMIYHAYFYKLVTWHIMLW